jgi:hypothetical protein
MQRASLHQSFVSAGIDVLLMPLVWCMAPWARRREAAILRDGLPLSEDQLALARAMGVAAAERVRVQPVNVIPVPLPQFLRHTAELLGWLSPHIAGMTLGYGIVLRRNVCRDRCLLAHELTHVAQFERLGRFRGFLREYVRECVWPGYPHGPLEAEARRAEIAAAGALTQRDGNVIPYVAAKVNVL